MTSPTHPSAAVGSFELSRQQKAFFDTFGFIHFRGLFRDEIEEIIRGFDRIFADHTGDLWEMHSFQNGGELRQILTGFLERDPTLSELRDDPRIIGIVEGLIGKNYDFADSDGNVWYCETYWHADTYGSPLSSLHVKLSFYLDQLNGDNGAIRLIPGTNHYSETFAETLRQDLAHHEGIMNIYGVEGDEVPCWTINNEPGDLIVWNQRTIHASFHGAERRRSFALTFKEGPEPVTT